MNNISELDTFAGSFSNLDDLLKLAGGVGLSSGHLKMTVLDLLKQCALNNVQLSGTYLGESD
jgi:hypothetical protein